MDLFYCCLLLLLFNILEIFVMCLYNIFIYDFLLQSDQKPKPQPRSKMPMNDFQLPDLPTVPSENNLPSNNPSTSEDIDFDDLMKRFEDLKKRK